MITVAASKYVHQMTVIQTAVLCFLNELPKKHNKNHNVLCLLKVSQGTTNGTYTLLRMVVGFRNTSGATLLELPQ